MSPGSKRSHPADGPTSKRTKTYQGARMTATAQPQTPPVYTALTSDEDEDCASSDVEVVESEPGESSYDVPEHAEDLVRALLSLRASRVENDGSREVVRSAKSRVHQLKQELSEADETVKREVERFRGFAAGEWAVRYTVEEGPEGIRSLMRKFGQIFTGLTDALHTASVADLVGSRVKVELVKAQLAWTGKALQEAGEALEDAKDEREMARANLEAAEREFVKAAERCEAALANQPSANDEVEAILRHLKAVGLSQDWL
ncbi:hypothetical protein BC834DRAFT_847358 [Gloeopeniophorella convolvens]|nr:hypothetical protein BC834DRAFT_847358 [Gloeopeniophorella convolvens]